MTLDKALYPTKVIARVLEEHCNKIGLDFRLRPSLRVNWSVATSGGGSAPTS